ncbi:NAD-dependent epimerase/dehydratase family protein [Ktedonosporobacter rubrisoli]|uniref:NAD-dependent epimerase/dehydratase family protein n=1 Tax=Ktedonosporobacter rubrisoli TaxID=2509675 RepID=A0A4P6JNQ9_KTERU|nr:NAD-dependent epimerase/dehydratase family protein [Ktedonosporobacter rubrisoli]QBD76948.1 NAD-dependent epimerase/dehydratase family protein [Ktedonosporobacter rubrisoli]
MKIFLTGATGYIGGSVAEKLVARGHHIIGLTRSPERAEQLQERGIEPLLGNLEDKDLLATAAKQVDAVINAADSDNASAVEALLPALEGSGKLFIQTSGSSIVGDKAAGEPGNQIFSEDSVMHPVPEKAGRIAIDRMVLDAAQKCVHSVVLCLSLIYGRGRGIHSESIQIPLLLNQARKSGIVSYIGRGLNTWSTVHIDDVTRLYLLALEKAPVGSFFYAENGEVTMKALANALSHLPGLSGKTASWSLEEAIQEWGTEPAVFALGSNSRVRGFKSRQLLGWKPKEASVLHEIEHGSYRHDVIR